MPLQERLASRTGSCPSRPAAQAAELAECYHAPTINQKSERLAVQLQAKSWAMGQVAVEDRLIASVQVKEEAPLPEQKPTINQNSEKILVRHAEAQTVDGLTSSPSAHHPVLESPRVDRRGAGRSRRCRSGSCRT